MEMIERIAAIIIPVFLMVGVGYAYGRLRPVSVREDMPAINRLGVDILAPLLVFTALASKDFDIESNARLILAGAAISLGSGLLAWPLARLLRYDVRTFIPPMMYNNCGNMGLPLAVFAFGPSGLSAAVALFMACNLVYFSAGVKILDSGRPGQAMLLLDFLLSPMMLAMIAGLIFAALHLSLPSVLFQALKMLGDAAIPIMLFSLGVRMLDVNLKSWHIGLIGAAACPLCGMAIVWLLDSAFVFTDTERAQMYLFASLPPAVFCFVMAERYAQEPDKVASIVMLGNLASIVFVPLGLWIGLRG